MNNNVPASVAILGLGPSVTQYLEIAKRHGGKHVDEVWGINALGQVFDCDRIFHQDDVRIQEIRAAARPESNIAVMLKWMRKHPGPIITSRAHPDYPGLVEFPLLEVAAKFNQVYFNSTAAYAVAYAVWLGVKRIEIYGADYTLANAHHAEKGRGCVEFWLGIAASQGIDIRIPHASSLMDACVPKERLYGYDTLDVKFSRDEAGALVMDRQPIPEEAWPDAETIEKNYCHLRHPNPLVEQAEEGEPDNS